MGAVNYTQRKLSKKDYVTLRTDFLDDFKGQTTGFVTAYSSHTLGWCHHFSQNMFVRPEIRYDHAYSVRAYDNGTRKNQFTAAADIVVRF